MNKRILFLCFTPQEKAEAVYCFGIYKALMRKFRKSISASFMQICTDKPCLHQMTEIYEKEVSLYDAVILCSSDRSSDDKNIFFREIAVPSIKEYHIAGKIVCSPYSEFSSEAKEEQISETVKSTSESIGFAASKAVQIAKSRKHTLAICTDSDSEIDRMLFKECEYALNRIKHIRAEHTTPEELIKILVNSSPSADVILTTDRWRKVILALISAHFEYSPVYSVYHTKNKRIYCRQGPSGSSRGKLSLLFAFGEILENEFEMKNAACWLKRCIGTAILDRKQIQDKELSSLLILEINRPIRQRRPVLRGKVNENTN